METTSAEFAARVAAIREEERFRELRRAFPFAVLRVGVPLHLSCWVLDLVFVPEQKWEFLLIRIAQAIVAYLLCQAFKRIHGAYAIQAFVIAFLGIAAVSITYMIVRLDSGVSPYYAGLNIVLLAVSIFPTSRVLFISSLLAIYGPFYFVVVPRASAEGNLRGLFVQSVFIACTAVCMFAARFFHERLRFLEVYHRVRLEFEVVRRRNAEEAVKALSQQVVHDIRAPIAALNTFVHNENFGTSEHVELVRRSVARIKSITNDLSRMGHGQVSEDAELVSSREVWELVNVAVSEKRHLHSSRTNLKFNFQDQFAPSNSKMKLDRSEFVRAVSNIIDNAIDSISESGLITIRGMEVVSDNRFVLEIEDNGCGISSGMLPSVKKRGFSGKVNGSGLGLAYADQVVSSWGGTLSLQSDEGNWTIVKIELPMSVG